MRFLFNKLLGPPSAVRGIAASAVIHSGAIATCLAVGWFYVDIIHQRPRLPGTVNLIRLEARQAVPRIQPLKENRPLVTQVIVRPREAQIGERRFHHQSNEMVQAHQVELPPRRAATLRPTHSDNPSRDTSVDTPPVVRQQAVMAVPKQVASTRGWTQATSQGNAPPIHPLVAWQQGLWGTVLLRITIAADGRVSQIEIARSSGHGVLDAAAVGAIKKWKFQPAILDGRPIESVEELPVRFPPPR